MPGKNLGYPYDAELFLMNWKAEKDPTLTAMFESGAVQRNGEIQNLISTGSDLYTIPFYNILGGTEDNYDGVSDINMSTPDGSSQTGVVYGRAHSWKDTDFVRDFNSGADPMKQITSQVAKFWQKKRQAIMLAVLNGIFTMEDNTDDKWDEWQTHTTNIATTAASVTEANKMGATTVGDALQKAVGDNAGIFSMAIMHSRVATNLAGLQLLQFRKYTDSMGIERQLSIADFNGLTVIVDDGVPVKVSSSASSEKEYTTYLLGAGALQYATAPVDTPVETGREELKGGGYNYYVTRMRETLHPNGFTFTPPSSSYTKSPTNAQLGASGTSNWAIVSNPKNIAIARIVSNG